MIRDKKFYFSVFWQSLQKENLDVNEIMYMKHPDILRIQVLYRYRQTSHFALLYDLFHDAEIFFRYSAFFSPENNTLN